MMKMKTQVVIIEDENAAAEYLSKLLTEIDNTIYIQQVLSTVEDSIKWFESNKMPDLLFVDIQLADGLSFNIFENINIECPIIFTTAYDSYAIQAFELNSIGYILKPFDEEDIQKALKKFKSNELKNYSDSNLYKTIMHDLIEKTHNPKFKKSILVQIKDKIIPIDVESIVQFITYERKVKAYTDNEKEYLIDFNMEEVENMIDSSKFFRTNRQMIINKDYIKDVTIWFGGKLMIHLNHPNTEKIIVSKQKVSDFKNWLTM